MYNLSENLSCVFDNLLKKFRNFLKFWEFQGISFDIFSEKFKILPRNTPQKIKKSLFILNSLKLKILFKQFQVKFFKKFFNSYKRRERMKSNSNQIENEYIWWKIKNQVSYLEYELINK